MNVKVISEYGYQEAIMGLSLSYNCTDMKRVERVATRLAKKDGGHNKFLESMVVYLDITAPRYWWQEFDTYRVGVTKQSESTMHTIMKKPINKYMFEKEDISDQCMEELEKLRSENNFVSLKRRLPEGFLQRRIVSTNYKTLKGVIEQRRNHKLAEEWGCFIESLELNLRHYYLI